MKLAKVILAADVLAVFATSSSTPSAHLAKEAMAFIRQNFKSGIGTEDVMSSVRGRSRRLLDMRFREMYGFTVYEAILRTRYGELKRRLVRSKTPICELMKACGFTDLSNAKRIFRARYGMSMCEWRERGK
jgi:AraC-like DNA-binding protein